MPLGVDADFEYEQSSVRLERGDSLTMFTDGISEAMNAAGDLYGLERLRENLAGEATDIGQLGQRILADVKRFVGQYPQSDDMCLVSFGCCG